MIVRKASSVPYGSWRWKFAYFPVTMDEGTLIWWERYRSRRVDTGHMDVEIRTQRHLTEGEDW